MSNKSDWRVHTLSLQGETFEFAVREHPQPQGHSLRLYEVRVQYTSRTFLQFRAYDILGKPETVFASGEGLFTTRENARELWTYLMDKRGFKHIRQDETDLIRTQDW